MAPTPQEYVPSDPNVLESEYVDEPMLEEDSIVISGMSGMYPEARDIKELADILYNKKNPLTKLNSRWEAKHPELTQYVGAAPDMNRFDSQFFTVNYNLAQTMDPMSRKLLEHTFQAIYDAGINPASLNGKKVAVYIGSSMSESEKNFYFYSAFTRGSGILGSSKTMYANRISYWLNAKGRSLSLDEADCSSTTALEQAYLSLRRGDCEAAIVGGAQLCLSPNSVIHHNRVGLINKDGTSKSFAEDANGYVLSDAINILLLQKAKDALRVYAQLLHVKNLYVASPKDVMECKFNYIHKFQTTANFIKDFYKEAQVLPQAVEYVEGYGTAIPDADKCELEAIAEVYCKDRTTPLLVGSVTSNIGLTQASSGIAGITKVLLGYHEGKIAANLNCELPRMDIKALRDGQMRIVTEHKPISRTYAAVNGFSLTGIRSHVLLYGQYKPKDLSRYVTSIPYLVTLSARQEPGVVKIFEYLKSHPIDAEEIALLHNIHCKNITGHLGRGYIILDTNPEKDTVSLSEKSEYFNGVQRPLWFVYSGMGSQWSGMGAQLMQIPIFASAIERCHKILLPKGLNIVEIITSPDEKMFDNILHSFVGIAAIQIGLTDILQALGLVPDGIIGHSVGELGCAYADNCLTSEEMILAAYNRGRVSLETPFIRGSMAAVGVGYEQISALCPPEIDVACRNSSTSSTISGPADIMKDFVTQLTTRGIFAKEVPCSNIAYHSRYIAEAGPKLLEYLKEVIKNPKPRTERWVSTSVPQDKWSEPLAKCCSAEYHTNNLLNPVLFEETLRLIPRNAVLLEVAPHSLLQAILKRSMLIENTYIPLTKRNIKNSINYLLQAIGDIYTEGFTVNTQSLYPKVMFPVSTETPMLSHLVEWMHSEDWPLGNFCDNKKERAALCKFVKSIYDNEHRYLQGHIIRNKMCYPFAAALVTVWDMFAMHMGLPKQKASITFKEVYFYAQPLLFKQKVLRLSVSLHRGKGSFEVRTDCSRVISGYITQNTKHILECEEAFIETTDTNISLRKKDIYQLLSDRGYNYSGEFRSIEWANASLTKAKIAWCDNWVTFIDGMLQLNALRQTHHTVSLLTCIREINIDVEEHFSKHILDMNGKNLISTDLLEVHDLTRCGGVTMKSIRYRTLPVLTREHRKSSAEPYIVGKVHNSQKDKISTSITLQCAEVGNLDSLQWLQNSKILRSNDHLQVTVNFAGINKVDGKKAIGIVTNNNNNTFGTDFSGVSKSGERVMGAISSGTVSTEVEAPTELLWPVPKHWSLEDAATVPSTYLFAFYALVMKGGLKPGMSILIHDGSDGIGHALIAVALAYGSRVFTTVSDMNKKLLLMKHYPELNENYIGNRRHNTFSDMVLQETQGEGCEIVISNVKGELKHAAIKCCRAFGVVIDTVQIEEHEVFEYGMHYMTKSRSYIRLEFSSIFAQENYEDRKILQNMVSEGIAAGYVKPLPRVTYGALDIKRAFKLFEQDQYCGRVLLRICDNMAQAQYRIVCDPDQYQILFWDDEVLGVQVAEILIHRGARNLYLISTSLTPYQLFQIQAWKKLGINVCVSTEDIIGDIFLDQVLNNALKQGPVEGIYIVLTATIKQENITKIASTLDKLDSMSRILCKSLKYFIIASATMGEKLCLSRINSGFTATWLDLSKMNHTHKTTASDVIDAVETARSSQNVTFVVPTKQVKPDSLYDQVIALADMHIPQHVSQNVTLQQLGLPDEKTEIICTFLNVAYNLSLEEREVPTLTLEEVRKLEKSVTDSVLLDVRGIATFLSNIPSDELLATADIIVLPTHAHNVFSIYNDYDISGQYLCIIPGIEGHHERFRALCERLKLPAIVLQPGLDHPHETVKQTAQRYAEILYKKTEIQDRFYILGYETGALVAVELAAILENRGLTGTIFCLGCTPNELHLEVQEQLKEYMTEEKLQNAIVRHIHTIMSREDSMDLDEKLGDTTSWRQKVEMCTNHLVGRMNHSIQFVRGLMEATLARLMEARRNTFTAHPLRSKVVVLRAATTAEHTQDAAIQQLSQQAVSVHQLQLPLSHAPTDMQCPALINQYLDDDILEEFENKNLCESYVMQTY